MGTVNAFPLTTVVSQPIEKSTLTADGNLPTRIAGVIGEVTRAQLAADPALTATYVPLITTGFTRLFNGGDPLGIADSTSALQAAADALTAGQTMRLQPGAIYKVNLTVSPTVAGNYYGLRLKSGVTFDMNGSTLLLAANQTVGVPTNGIAIIGNNVPTGGDENIVVMNGLVDGNGANQTLLHNGIVFIRTRGCKCINVRVQNVRGNANFPPGETFHFETQLGLDTSFIGCEAIGSAGLTGSGFSADNCTNVSWVDCTGRGMSAGHGFTAYQVVNLSWVNCRAYLNGSFGFNVEESLAPRFTNCHAGGQVALGSTPYPFATGTSLGNTGTGFVINGCAQSSLAGCSSRKNSLNGIVLVPGSASYGACSGRAIACDFTDNAAAGVSVPSGAPGLALEKLWKFGSDSFYRGNAVTAFDIPQGYNGGPGNHFQCTGFPAVPASGVAVTNPYPWAVDVYIDGGVTALRRVNGADVGAGAPVLHLDVGDTITIFWSTIPTWIWFPSA